MASAPERPAWRQLAGSGAEVEHPWAGRGRERPAHRGLRVIRTMRGVRGGRCPERRAEKWLSSLLHPASPFGPKLTNPHSFDTVRV